MSVRLVRLLDIDNYLYLSGIASCPIRCLLLGWRGNQRTLVIFENVVEHGCYR